MLYYISCLLEYLSLILLILEKCARAHDARYVPNCRQILSHLARPVISISLPKLCI